MVGFIRRLQKFLCAETRLPAVVPGSLMIRVEPVKSGAMKMFERCECNGVLLSWALPVGPTCLPEVDREAIEMEDHRLENILFEGLHETGPIMLWDRGLWIPKPDAREVRDSLQEGIYDSVFVENGSAVSGRSPGQTL
jgi:hypothetical protein